MGFSISKEVLFLEMRELIQTEFYSINLLDSSVEIKVKRESRVALSLSVILSQVFTLPFVAILFFGIRDKRYFYVCLSVAAILSINAMLIRGLLIQIKKEKIYLFLINQDGVFHTDVNKMYQLTWEQIVCYGIIKNNSISGVRRTPYNTQSCIVFSKELYNDKEWYKKLDRIVYKRYSHASTDSTIVLDLRREDDGEIYNQIKKYIEKFCKNATEINL